MNGHQPLKTSFAAAQICKPPRPRLKSEDLFRNSHEVVIDHHGEEYRLRLTRNNKLILNK
ncbi:MAG: hemin uptake protein HemP [Pseudomonadota bacterium]